MSDETHCTTCGWPIPAPENAHRFRFPDGRHAGIYCCVEHCPRCGEEPDNAHEEAG